MCLRIYVSTYLRIYVSTYLRIYASTYLCFYVSMYICIYVSGRPSSMRAAETGTTAKHGCRTYTITCAPPRLPYIRLQPNTDEVTNADGTPENPWTVGRKGRTAIRRDHFSILLRGLLGNVPNKSVLRQDRSLTYWCPEGLRSVHEVSSRIQFLKLTSLSMLT